MLISGFEKMTVLSGRLEESESGLLNGVGEEEYGAATAELWTHEALNPSLMFLYCRAGASSPSPDHARHRATRV